MDYKVVITESAIETLREIVVYIARDDPAAAARVGNKLLDAALTLETMPARCGYFDAARGIRRLVVAPYLIFFTVDEAPAAVNVTYFWHGARQDPTFDE